MGVVPPARLATARSRRGKGIRTYILISRHIPPMRLARKDFGAGSALVEKGIVDL